MQGSTQARDMRRIIERLMELAIEFIAAWMQDALLSYAGFMLASLSPISVSQAQPRIIRLQGHVFVRNSASLIGNRKNVDSLKYATDKIYADIISCDLDVIKSLKEVLLAVQTVCKRIHVVAWLCE